MAVGVLRGKRVDHLSLDWDIQNYFTSREKHVDIRIPSPQFIFGGCTWRLFIYPNDDPYRSNIGYSEIHLQRLESSIKRHDVSFTFGFKNRDGSTYIYKTCTTSFDKKNPIIGSGTIVLDSQSELAAGGNLTIFLQLVLNKVVVDDVEQAATPTDEVRNTNNNEREKQNRPKDDADSVFKVILRKRFDDKFQNLGNSDVIFKVQDHEIHAHREVLAPASPVLISIFGYDVSKNTGVVNIHDWGAEAFKELLLILYVYLGSTKPSFALFDLYDSAANYELKHLKKKFIEFMKKDMSIDEFLDTMAIALKHKEIKYYATEFFARKMQLILPTERWKIYLKDNYLEANDLTINALKENYFFKSHSRKGIAKTSEEIVII